MPQVQQFDSNQETETSYRSEQTTPPRDTRSAVSKADTMTEEERRAINKPGRGAFGEELTGEIPASARHVRPEELVAALSAIEARKGEAVVGTQPLGMALLQTNASVPSEVIWEEIQKQREKQTRVGATRTAGGRRRTPLWMQIGVGAACIGATFAAVRILMGDIRVVQEKTAGPQPPQNLVNGRLPTIPLKPHQYVPDRVFIEEPDMISLADLPEGKPFFLDPHRAQQVNTLLNGDSGTLPVPKEQLKDFYLSPRAMGNEQWSSVVRGGKVYVRGWVNVPPGAKPGDLYAKQIQLFNRPDFGSAELSRLLSFGGSGSTPPPTDHLRQITISVDSFGGMSSTSTGNYATMLTTLKGGGGISWEPWEPLPMRPDANIQYVQPFEHPVYISSKRINLPVRQRPNTYVIGPGQVVSGTIRNR